MKILKGVGATALVLSIACGPEAAPPVSAAPAPSAAPASSTVASAAPPASAVTPAKPAPPATTPPGETPSAELAPFMGEWVGAKYAALLKQTRSPKKAIQPCPPAQLILAVVDGKLTMHRDLCMHEGMELAIAPGLAKNGHAITILDTDTLKVIKWPSTIDIGGPDQLAHGKDQFVPARTVTPGATSFDDAVALTTIGKTAYLGADGKDYVFKPKGEAVWAGAPAGYWVESHYQGSEPLGTADGYVYVGASAASPRDRQYAFAIKGAKVELFKVPANDGPLATKPDLVLTAKP